MEALSQGLVEHRPFGVLHILDDPFALQVGMGVKRLDGETDRVANARAGRDYPAVMECPMRPRSSDRPLSATQDNYRMPSQGLKSNK